MRRSWWSTTVALSLMSLGCAHGAGRQRTMATLSPETSAAFVQAALVIMADAKDAVPVCLAAVDSIGVRELPRGVIRQLAPRARSRADCPPTYSSMVVGPDATPRPPGYTDPYKIEFRLPYDGRAVHAWLWQGTGFSVYQCAVSAPLESRMTCRVTSRGFA